MFYAYNPGAQRPGGPAAPAEVVRMLAEARALLDGAAPLPGQVAAELAERTDRAIQGAIDMAPGRWGPLDPRPAA
ncbi:hypothetical protein [Kitasatospora sp. NPDC088783]|uniref:hypothetical protein n=1 Tax=Kitasatospora sp. NPDC088783 TaxID=3364077 RepID=UPI0037FB4DA8